MNTDNHFRFEDIKSSPKLPSPAEVALEIMRITSKPDTNLKDVADVLRTDPALSGHILKYVNSAYLSLTRPINSVDDAVIHLGMMLTKQLALSFSVLTRNKQGACPNFNYIRFWARSLFKATSSQMLSLHDGHFIPEEVFTFGLLSNIGQLALASVYPQEYTRVLECHASQADHSLEEIERDIIGVDSLELTAMLLQDWGLSEHYIGAICMAGSHLDLDMDLNNPDEVQDLARIFDFSSRLTELFFQQTPPEELPDHIESEIVDFTLTRQSAMATFDDIVQKCTHWGEIFGIDLHAESTYVETILDKKNSSGILVLVIDDDLITQKMVSKQLTDLGHRVLTANDGEEGLKVAISEEPDVVFTDWQMPKLDGPSLCKMLRDTPSLKQTYIIMLTARQKEEELIQALHDGADDYIVKPFRPRVLKARLLSGIRLIKTQKEIRKDKAVIESYTTKLKESNRRFEKLALTDDLTGLPNRRHGMFCLKKLLASEKRNELTVSCILVDIDHFKRVNDVHGHDVGDLILQKTSRVLAACLRSDDFICRYGGEEFLIICLDNHKSGTILAERMRTAIEKNHIDLVNGQRISVTISLGIAASNKQHSLDINDLLKQADIALYNAKKAGRNCLVLSQPLTEA